MLPGAGVHFTKCDPQTAWERLLPWHGEEVNGSTLAATLTSACAYLNSGDATEARKWVDRLPLPPLRPEALAKINNAWAMQPRVPAGSPEGGRFTSEDGGFQQASMFRSRTPVDVTDDKGEAIVTPEGKFKGKPMQRPDDLPPSFFVDQGLAAKERAKAGIGLPGEIGSPDLSTFFNPRTPLYNFRQGGAWDAQRVGPNGEFDDAFVDYSTVGIGLYGASAGISMEEILTYQNQYARFRSTYPPGTVMDPVYRYLPARNVDNTRLGYELYRSGRIGPSIR